MNQETNRRPNLAAALFTTITIALALITLLGVAQFPLLPDFSVLGDGLVQIVVVIGAIAVIIGILNLIAVHLRKISTFPSGIYSIVTLVTFVLVLIVHALEARGIIKIGSSDRTLSLTLMDVLQVTIESALAGLMFFFLVFSAYRLLRRRVTIWGVIFISALLIVLLGYTQPPGTLFYNFREWLLSVPVSAGIRGLLIGVAIGTVVVGVRVLVGQNRQFRE